MSVIGDDKPPRVARGLYKRFAIASVLIVLLSAGTVASAALLEIDDLVTTFRAHSTPIPNIAGALDGVDAGEPQTILVLGSDRRYGDVKSKLPSRSDTMMLVRLDPSKAATAVMSIPRDLKVTIPASKHNAEYTDKINAAYAIGGPALSVRTVKRLLGIKINRVINVNFGGFQRAVNRLGCVYIDVDQKYFNDGSTGENYATIDVPAGYQRLCGQDSLDYVRYRHTDSDFVRAARQQDYLRQAKDQIGAGDIWNDRKTLLDIFGRYTQTDIDTRSEALQLLRLVFESSGHPIREVQFEVGEDGSYVTISPQKLRKARNLFLNAEASKGPRASGSTDGDADKGTSAAKTKMPARKGSSSTLPAGVIDARVEGENYVVTASTRLRFPVYFPRVRLGRGQYIGDGPRTYKIADRSKKQYDAYRIVLSAGETGQYYGVQGMTWRSPPILDDPTDEETMGGRKFQLFYDGNRIRLIAWRTPKAVYWVSNTLMKTLTNDQMRAIARSLQRVGQK